MYQKNNVEINNYDINTQRYLKEIGSRRPLRKNEEYKLWKEYKEHHNIGARDKLIESNLKFVTNVAKWYKGRGLSYDDLIQEGNIGLIKALDKFDATKGYKVISYAVHWIKQAIAEAVERRNAIGGDELPDDNKKPSITVNADGEVEDFAAEPEYEILDEVEDREAELVEKRTLCGKLLNVLDEREFEIIVRNFGLKGEVETLEEIGLDLGITKERTRQLKEHALKKMREQSFFL